MTDMTHLSWGLVNDTYKMDLVLIYPPYMIALACIYIASVLKDKDTTAWFEELRADMNVVKNISMEILDFYDNHKILPEDRTNAIFNKISKSMETIDIKTNQGKAKLVGTIICVGGAMVMSFYKGSRVNIATSNLHWRYALPGSSACSLGRHCLVFMVHHPNESKWKLFGAIYYSHYHVWDG
ncbi:hypothetical protein C5167_023901 [Papaver somniferum]|uniref:Cyclin C-terminal domain-containing protein n=1 Tax=Papaver somniferum TaxID=3469 RepID=A0A4Y7JQY2_PAPSO|nr:hypothetical protein C5167_023901 [Papaver somniferum]